MQWAFSRRNRHSVAVNYPRRTRRNDRARDQHLENSKRKLRRRALFETLEERTVFAPLGAMPDDTGDYMLGDVLVTVVLMESDPTLPGADVSTENWTQSTINAVKTKVQDGMNYWKQTLANATQFYNNPDMPLLNFKFDFTWADNPVPTQYEPINRYASYHELWINDFLNQPNVNFANSLDIYKDVKAFNNFQREKYGTDWAFTIFVANSTNSVDDFFPVNPTPAVGEVTYRGAYAFLGGQFLVVPSDRPTTTFAHEAGHIFYALDEYTGGHSYYQKSGYYNAQNLNGATNNPTANFLNSQQPSIMGTGTGQQTAFNTFVTSTSSMATIGWRDSDGDGVMDVLDVPFTLNGGGSYNSATGTYKFKGTSSVQTLKNENTFGGQHTDLNYNDISINKIRRAEYSLDGGAWTTAAEYTNLTTANLDLTITGLSAGAHILKIRTFDQRTGASSPEFVAEINPANEPTPPEQTTYSGGISGYAFRDDNANGVWDNGEQPLVDWGVELRTVDDTLLKLATLIEPNNYSENTMLNSVEAGVNLSVIGATSGGSMVLSRTVTNGSNKIFYAASSGNETFATKRDFSGNNLSVDRKLKAEFLTPTTTVSLTAIGTGASVGRLDAYDANGNLVGRYTTSPLGAGQTEVMTITHATADIKYVIASSHLETEVMFDTLSIGPQTATTTNADGSFNLAALPAGTYNLQVITHPNYNPISPIEGRVTVTVTPGSSASNNLYFAYQFGGNPWHNLLDPLNTNGTGGITAFDAIIVINYLILYPTGNSLVASEAQAGMYIDVNNDSRITAFDVIPIINFLNEHPAGSLGTEGGDGGEGTYETRGSTSSGSGTGGGTIFNTNTDYGSPGGGGSENAGGETPAVAQNADQYFANHPLHVSQRFKDQSHEDHDDDDADVIASATDGSLSDDHDVIFQTLSTTQDDESNDDTIFTTTATPLTNELLSLVERLRRLKESATRDKDQFDPRLLAIRTALGDDFDPVTATSDKLAQFKLLMKQNFRRN
ncbi:dockerin type I domain-containing protein [Anatilimnocola floriformis]|uniref:dockerin type I domain-containing protein n=1 Tax=Anatilimnocola floriformis TaxID=2948575 RepID=UPI0020C4179D|nr:dockerin type I domain-containing protein [Anatilimnocola floriformis]